MLSFQNKKRMQNVMRKHPPININNKIEERASNITCGKGSICLEAAIVLPIFIAAVIAVLFFIQAILIEMRLQKALYNQIMKTSGMAYFVGIADMSETVEQIMGAEYVKNEVIKEVGREFLNNSYIVNGYKGIGIDYLCKAEEGLLDVRLIYYMNVPFNIFGIQPVKFTTHMVNHTWVGETENDTDNDVNMVYIASSGKVYHLYRDCSYILSKIYSCIYDEIGQKRNENGSRYQPCKVCASEPKIGSYFYTKYGIRYHVRPDCRNLYSNVFEIDIEMVKDKYSVCSKCEKRRNGE